MTTTTEQLFQEILDNARRDRKTLEEVRDGLVKAAKTAAAQVAEDGGLTMMAIAEQVAKLADSLTRSNAQLVEISKVKAKEGPPPEDDAKDSVDSIYDEISQSQSGSDEKAN